jgi:hypothetical protein
MALTFFSSEAEAWKQAVAGAFPGAKGWVETRGWEDPSPVWLIKFNDDHIVSNTSKLAAAREADAYFRAVSRLTGESP